jgi:hypothetical protein
VRLLPRSLSMLGMAILHPASGLPMFPDSVGAALPPSQDAQSLALSVFSFKQVISSGGLGYTIWLALSSAARVWNNVNAWQHSRRVSAQAPPGPARRSLGRRPAVAARDLTCGRPWPGTQPKHPPLTGMKSASHGASDQAGHITAWSVRRTLHAIARSQHQRRPTPSSWWRADACIVY